MRDFTKNYSRQAGQVLLAATSALAISGAALAGHHAEAKMSASASANASADTQTAEKKIFTGVIEAVKSKTVNGEKQAMVTLVSGSDRRMNVHLGALSKLQRNRLILDSRMDVIGEQQNDNSVMASRANVNGEAFIGSGIGAKELTSRVAQEKNNFTGLVSNVAGDAKKTTLAVTSGVGTTVQTTIETSKKTKEFAKKGVRASVVGEVENRNQVEADRVVLAGGAAEAKAGKMASAAKTMKNDVMAGASETMSKDFTVSSSNQAAIKTNYSGVIVSSETIVVDDVEQTMVTLRSGSKRTVNANLGELSDDQVALLTKGSRMDVIGKLDGSGIIDAEEANLNGSTFIVLTDE